MSKSREEMSAEIQGILFKVGATLDQAAATCGYMTEYERGQAIHLVHRYADWKERVIALADGVGERWMQDESTAET